MKIVKLLLNLSGFILMLGILGCARQVTDPNQALLILADNLEAHNGISYDASMKFKPFNGRDTVEIEAVVKRLRSRMGILSGAARVGGTVVCYGTMTFALGAKSGSATQNIIDAPAREIAPAVG